jgi:hypothetical protein
MAGYGVRPRTVHPHGAAELPSEILNKSGKTCPDRFESKGENEGEKEEKRES